MTFQEMYDRIVYKLWGNSNLPTGAQNILYYSNGIIANIHRKIQQERDYWFMEAETTIPVLAGSNGFALPALFKEVVRCGFRFQDGSGNYDYPLTALNVGEEWQIYRQATDVSEYPEYYDIFGGLLYLKPAPSKDITLYIRCYKYLPKLNLPVDEDILCQFGYDAIINLSCAEYLEMNKEFQEAQAYAMRGLEALEILKKTDMQMRRAEIVEIEYGDY